MTTKNTYNEHLIKAMEAIDEIKNELYRLEELLQKTRVGIIECATVNNFTDTLRAIDSVISECTGKSDEPVTTQDTRTGTTGKH